MMTIDLDILSMFTEVNTWIKLAAPATKDDRGNRTYGSDVKYRAFLQYAEREFRTGTTESRVPRAIISVIPVVINDDGGPDTILSAMPNITPEYRLTLMDGSKPPITSVDNAIGDGELDHITIFT